MQLFQKSYSRDTWPAISFTGNESSAFHLVTNAVNVYDPTNFASGLLCLSTTIGLWHVCA